MKLAKRILALTLTVVMFVVGMVIPASAATSVFYYFPLVTESMGGGYMAAAVAVQKFLMLYNSSYATRLLASGGTDGFFGSTSAAVTKSFQSGNSLEADGKVGSKTWLKFEAYLDPRRNSSVGGTVYMLKGNSVYSADLKVISYPYSNGYCAYNQAGKATAPFYYPQS